MKQNTTRHRQTAGNHRNCRHGDYVRYLSYWRSLANRKLALAIRRGNLTLQQTVEQECQLVALLQSGIIPALIDHLPEYRATANRQRGKFQAAITLYRSISTINA